MHRKEVILQSPLRLLDRSLRGGLGRGQLGAILAGAGVGKSACLVHLGLDALLRDKPVLHVAVGHPVEHVSAWYDGLFDEVAERVGLSDRGGVRESISHRRLIWSFAEGAFRPPALDEALAAFQAHLRLDPAVILLDGVNWAERDAAAALAAVKESAARVHAELWITVRAGTRDPADAAPLRPLSDHAAALVDVGVFLEPHGRYVRVTLVKDRERIPPAEVPLVLQGGTLRLLGDDEAAAPVDLPPDSFTLLASGCPGAEEEFGSCAERWGVQEVNFTFQGRGEVARTRGLVELSEDELKMGDVSTAYVRAHLHRTFPPSANLGRVLQAIWHQVSGAGEVFFVGTVNPDKTVHGGTGWAVELARHWGKPLHVFDQGRSGWFRWDQQDWIAVPPPVITRVRFAGAGTRTLEEAGRVAIRSLFERSFGAPAA